MSPAQARQHHRTILLTAGLVLAVSVFLALFLSSPTSSADTQTTAGEWTWEVVQDWAKPVTTTVCIEWSSSWGFCTGWETTITWVACTEGEDGCVVFNEHAVQVCSGYVWAGNCLENVPHTHPPTTTEPEPTTTTTTTTPTTTEAPPDCDDDEHQHGDDCHPDHPENPCGGYYVHSGDDGHTWVPLPPCNSDPPPSSDPVCTGATHAYGSGCHADHVPPTCVDGVTQTYTYHGSGGSHVTGTVPPCAGSTTTTTEPLVCDSGLDSGEVQELRDVVGGLVGWETSFPNDGSVGAVWAGDEPPQAGGSFWFIASDKISSPGSVEPPVWPVSDGVSAEGVEDDGGCWWFPVETWSRWHSLKPWSYTERLKIGSVAPDWVDRWNRMSSVEQAETRARWEALERDHPDPSVWCDVDEADPEGVCGFFVPYTAVWEWSIYVRVETEDDGELTQEVVKLHSGVSMVRRLVDYSDGEWTTSGFGGDE